MTLRLQNWKRLLLSLGAGAFLCASIGCNNTRGERGPNLNAPTNAQTKAMGPGNQVAKTPTSPAYNNLASQGTGPGVQTAQMNRVNQTAPMQGMQIPQTNQVQNNQPAFGPQNAPMGNVVVPTQYPPQGFVPNGYPQQNQMQPAYPQQQQMQPMYPQQNQMQPAYPQQQQMQPNYPMQPTQQNFQQVPQQPPLMQYQGPGVPLPTQGMPTSMNHGLKVPDVIPATARDVGSLSGPSLLPATMTSSTPTLEPMPSSQKDPPVRVLAEYNPGSKRTAETPVVTTTPVLNDQPVLEAPVTYPK